MPLGRPRSQGLPYIPWEIGFFDDPRMKKLGLELTPLVAIGFVITICKYIFQSPVPYLVLSPDVEKLLIEEMKISRKSFTNHLSATFHQEIFDSEKWKSSNIITADWIVVAFNKVMNHRERNRNPGTGPPTR